MKRWTPLRAGDLVDVVAPASPASSAEIASAKSFLREQGFRFWFPKVPSIAHPYLAGSDQVRAQALLRALKSSSRGIWCLRGGYGAARTLGYLQEMKRPSVPKLFIGLSDITALHLFLNQVWGWPTLHAPVLTRMGMRKGPPKEATEILEVVRGERLEIRHALIPMNAEARRSKVLEGKVRGGNLTVLQSLIGTETHPQLRGRFVFLEDVGERGYRVDRTLNHCLRAGIFDGVRGVLLGDFVGGDEPGGQNFVSRALKEFSNQVSFPVWGGIRSGHGDLQRPVAFETDSALEKIGSKFFLTQATGART